MEHVYTGFHGEQDFRHHGNLHWPGYLGYPIRHNDSMMVIKEEDYSKLVPVADFYSKLFNLSDPQDKEYYDWVMKHIVGRMFEMGHREIRWEKDSERIYVYMEWTQNYFEFPKGYFDKVK